jgi:putative flippase GtrA
MQASNKVVMNTFKKILSGEEIWAKAGRFVLVGGASTLIYGVATLVAVRQWAMSPMLATLVGYLVAIPFNYLLQRVFTFKSKALVRRELPRFLIIHGLNMAGSFGMMALIVEALRADYRWGIAATMTVVPFLVFLTMDAWVFRRAPR